MSQRNFEILTIQKLVFLLTDFHYAEFIAYLKRTKVVLPLKMVNAIRRKLPDFHTPEELCRVVYGNSDAVTKKKFNQLSSHTFRLTGYLAVYHPAYLHANATSLHVLANKSKWNQAVFMAKAMLDIAEKTDDFKCQVISNSFLAEKSFLFQEYSAGVRYAKAAHESMQMDIVFMDIHTKLRSLLQSEREPKGKDILSAFHLLETHFDSRKDSFRILSMFYYLQLLYVYKPLEFDTPRSKAVIENLSKELNNYSHVILPFSIDVKGTLFFMRFNYVCHELEPKERKRLLAVLKENYEHKPIGAVHLSRGELSIFTVEVTQLFSKYHHLVGLKNYRELIANEDRKEIDELLKKLNRHLIFPAGVSVPDIQLRTMRMLLGSMLIISGGRDVKAGIFELEALLTAYQQVNLGALTDKIFLSLMVGYFALSDYHNCAITYKRYLKVKKGKPILPDSDLWIHTYYYLSRYLITGKHGYIDKMKERMGIEDKNAIIKALFATKGVLL